MAVTVLVDEVRSAEAAREGRYIGADAGGSGRRSGRRAATALPLLLVLLFLAAPQTAQAARRAWLHHQLETQEDQGPEYRPRSASLSLSGLFGEANLEPPPPHSDAPEPEKVEDAATPPPRPGTPEEEVEAAARAAAPVTPPWRSSADEVPNPLRHLEPVTRGAYAVSPATVEEEVAAGGAPVTPPDQSSRKRKFDEEEYAVTQAQGLHLTADDVAELNADLELLDAEEEAERPIDNTDGDAIQEAIDDVLLGMFDEQQELEEVRSQPQEIFSATELPQIEPPKKVKQLVVKPPAGFGAINTEAKAFWKDVRRVNEGSDKLRKTLAHLEGQTQKLPLEIAALVSRRLSLNDKGISQALTSIRGCSGPECYIEGRAKLLKTSMGVTLKGAGQPSLPDTVASANVAAASSAAYPAAL